MRTLVAPALLAYAKADETSLMQGMMKRSTNNLAADVSSSRQDSTSKLLDTAVNMIKNGVTPDVITFVDATNQDINEEVLVAIQSEHDIDQAYINNLCQDFLNAVEALEQQAAAIAVHGDNRLAAQESHHNCRADEAFSCAKSRRCEEQLREKWRVVKHEETVMREIHGHIHDEWCIHPPFFAEIGEWLSHPFNWAQTSPYPILDLPEDVRDFRHVSVTHFRDYMEQKIIVERAWTEYNEKLEECATLEEAWESKVPVCDAAQTTARQHACEHATANRAAREQFGQEWNRITALFNEAQIAKAANEAARKNEWETLKIVQCLLDHVHSSVITSIETGAPCPTVDSDPDGVTLAIEDCHIVTRGCGEDSLTAHLCLDWCEPPPVPPLPPVEEPACTPMYVAKEQSAFLAAIGATYTAELAANTDFVGGTGPLTAYETGLSAAGWAGCAPPLVCVDCEGQEPVEPCLEHVGGAHQCHLHEQYLSAGQSNQDTFRCLDGTCITQAGRCNGHNNCADGSDETGCDADDHVFVPAYLASQFECPADKHDDVHFTCANSMCIDKVGMCNGIENCADGSDEAHCSGALQVTLEAKSGRTITVESLQSGTGVFHDREYNFDSLGSFSGKTFIKYSNDDKAIDYEHVMTKIRTAEPVTVFLAMFNHNKPAWLEAQGFSPASKAGVSFSGVRETRHKEWDNSLLTTDHFDYSAVYSKVFPAGTISIPGNNGGDGSFLIFLDRPNAEDEYDSRLTAYWEEGNCGVHNNDWNWQWCGQQAGDCALRVATDLCDSGEAELAHYHGTGAQGSYVDGAGCRYWYLAQYRCAAATPVPDNVAGEAEFIGCFVDDGARDLGAMVGTRDNAATNTFELCRAACADHTYMSLQYGGECFCSNSYGNGDQYAQVDESECNAIVEPCHSSSYNCGGTWRQAIYQINFPPYHYGQPAGNSCPTEDVAEANCLAAVQSLLPSGQIQGRTHLVAGSWGWVPPGCSVQSHFTHGQDGDWAAHYNRNSGGVNDGGYTPVCTAGQPSYLVSRADTKCPHNHEDRLFRSPESGSSQISLQQCYAECATTAGCNHFSWGEWQGAYVCMGCTSLEHAQTHEGFTAFDMHMPTPPRDTCTAQCKAWNHLHYLNYDGDYEIIETMDAWVNVRGGMSSLTVEKMGGEGSCVVSVADHNNGGNPFSHSYPEGEYQFPLPTGNDNIGSIMLQCVPETQQWTMVLQYGASAYTPNAGAVGTLRESQKAHAKLSDADINALPSGGDGAYDYYKLTSESASANVADVMFMRVQGAYDDTSPTLGFSSWEVCFAASIESCTSWSVARGGTHGIDTYYTPGRTPNNCDRWFTGYQNSILCYPQQSSGGRCWATGNTCSLGSHAIRQDVKMYKLTA